MKKLVLLLVVCLVPVNSFAIKKITTETKKTGLCKSNTYEQLCLQLQQRS
jgi:hypothetical protein